MSALARFITMRICILLLMLAVLSCIKAPEYPDEPQLTFEGMSANTMVQSDFNTDSVLVLLSFTDGDGDVGDDNELNLFVTDTRDDFIAARYRLPLIPVAGSNNGVSGDIQIVLYTTCCTYDNGQAPCTPSETSPIDTVVYEIYMMDRSGNQSNVVSTEPIILFCN